MTNTAFEVGPGVKAESRECGLLIAGLVLFEGMVIQAYRPCFGMMGG